MHGGDDQMHGDNDQMHGGEGVGGAEMIKCMEVMIKCMRAEIIKKL